MYLTGSISEQTRLSYLWLTMLQFLSMSTLLHLCLSLWLKAGTQISVTLCGLCTKLPSHLTRVCILYKTSKFTEPNETQYWLEKLLKDITNLLTHEKALGFLCNSIFFCSSILAFGKESCSIPFRSDFVARWRGRFKGELWMTFPSQEFLLSYSTLSFCCVHLQCLAMVNLSWSPSPVFFLVR
ncbi:hypothetical protein M758_UG059000 [Ceratodon purpureus]|nr:hypothetical protein M758_UG059000 [Ceratodon purpureus]